ncbi:hypothetical protein ISCGN_007596 [Ixodes scapularis]
MIAPGGPVNLGDSTGGTSKKGPRVHWSEAETWSLIRLWEDNIGELRRQRRNAGVYETIRLGRPGGRRKVEEPTRGNTESFRSSFAPCVPRLRTSLRFELDNTAGNLATPARHAKKKKALTARRKQREKLKPYQAAQLHKLTPSMQACGRSCVTLFNAKSTEHAAAENTDGRHARYTDERRRADRQAMAGAVPHAVFVTCQIRTI